MRYAFRPGCVPSSVSLAAVVVGVALVHVPPAGADEIDELFGTVEELSREAAVNNDEVLALEEEMDSTRGKIADAEERVAASQSEVEISADEAAQAQQNVDDTSHVAQEASRLAREARAAQDALQEEIDVVAGARYRGVLIDPLTNAVNARDPQSMIDRASYMGVLYGDASEKLEILQAENAATAQRASRANAAVAEASWSHAQAQEAYDELIKAHQELEAEQNQLTTHQTQLERQRQQLVADQKTLDEQISVIQAQIDGLSPEHRQRWESRSEPISIDASAIATDGVVGAAMSKIGAPYGWGAAGPDQFDCSGLMYWAHQQQGKAVPRTSQAQIAGGQSVSRSELQPGDIVGFYPGVTHVGMYIGNGQIVHASDYGVPVQVVALDSMPFAGASRY